MIHDAWMVLIRREYFLRSFARKIAQVDIVFEFNGGPIGVYCPHVDKSGFFRVGPIWVHPDYRGKGYCSAFVASVTKGKKARALIEDTNEASQRAFSAAGFILQGRGNRISSWWVKP